MRKQLLFTALCLTFMTQAQNIFRDDFSTYTQNQQLSGQGAWTNNSSNSGGLGNAITGSGGSNAFILDNAVYAQNYGDAPVSVELKPNSDGCGRAFTSVTGGNLYVGFVINLSAAQANNNSDFFRVMSGDNFNTSFRMYAVSSGTGYTIGISKGANGNPIAFTPNALAFGENSLIILKYTQGAGAADDVLSAYINGEYQSGEPALPTMTTNSGADQAGNIDRLSFRQNWTNGMPTGRVGLVSVSTTWAGLGFLPLSTTVFDNNGLFVDATLAKVGAINISCQSKIENANVKIYTLSGILLDNNNVFLNEMQNRVAVTPIQSEGIYIVEITDNANQKRYIKKMIVK